MINNPHFSAATPMLLDDLFFSITQPFWEPKKIDHCNDIMIWYDNSDVVVQCLATSA
jgi:hypothetical protein